MNVARAPRSIPSVIEAREPASEAVSFEILPSSWSARIPAERSMLCAASACQIAVATHPPQPAECRGEQSEQRPKEKTSITRQHTASRCTCQGGTRTTDGQPPGHREASTNSTNDAGTMRYVVRVLSRHSYCRATIIFVPVGPRFTSPSRHRQGIEWLERPTREES